MFVLLGHFVSFCLFVKRFAYLLLSDYANRKRVQVFSYLFFIYFYKCLSFEELGLKISEGEVVANGVANAFSLCGVNGRLKEVREECFVNILR